MEKSKDFIKILSFNAWLLPYGISKDNTVRKKSLVRALVGKNADIYVLQEIWKNSDKRRIIKEFKKYGYNYNYFTNVNIFKRISGFLGNGLLIISRLHLETKSHLEFRDFTRIEEYMVNKGALHCIINKDNFHIDLFNTHLGSIYYDPISKKFSQKDIDNHSSQLSEFENFVKKSSIGNIIIVAGDFNWPIREYDHDKKEFINKESSKIKKLRKSLNLEEPIEKSKKTYSSNNPYAVNNTVGGLIDYVMINKNQKFLTYHNQEIVLDELLPETGKTLSDHYGVLTTLKIKKGMKR